MSTLAELYAARLAAETAYEDARRRTLVAAEHWAFVVAECDRDEHAPALRALKKAATAQRSALKANQAAMEAWYIAWTAADCPRQGVES